MQKEFLKSLVSLAVCPADMQWFTFLIYIKDNTIGNGKRMLGPGGSEVGNAKTIWRPEPEQKWISGHGAQVSEIVCSPE